MKQIGLIILIFSIMCTTYGQQKEIDSLKNVVNKHREDTNTVKALIYLYDLTNYRNLDSAIAFSQQGLLLAKKIKYEKGEALCYIQLANGNNHLGSFSQAIHFNFKALDIYKQLQDIEGMAVAHLSFEVIYKAAGDYGSSLSHAFAVKRLVEGSDRMDKVPWAINGLRWKPLILAEISDTYEKMNQLDSAFIFAQKAIKEDQHINGAEWNFPIQVLGRILMNQGKYAPALAAFHIAIPLATQNGYPKDTLDVYNSLAILFKSTGNLDSAIYYANKIMDNRSQISHIKILLEATTTLAQVYKLKGDKDNTLKYIEFSNVLRDSVYSQEKQREFQNLTFNEQIRQQEIQQQQLQNSNKIRVYILILGLFSLGVIAFILYRSNIHKQKANSLLQKQKQEIEQQRTKAESALEDLKSTQAQLIQSEKMASLGQLTAGIAHEIQNPLNFVNNFSEINKELIAELREEIEKGDLEEVKVIANDIEENEQKIIHHGKRAGSIVKGMLEHSRASTGKKELTDINALVDECVRLSYHGMRAKDKEFNSEIKTELDGSVGKVHIVSQDISKVLLNLLNNAFYAVDEKKRQQNGMYEPAVSVCTRKLDGKVEIYVRDNGNGIPQNIVDKIFQPFFTTKPTGQGTGLGLSLSYDIIKAHGGEIKVESKEGEGAEFIIVLLLT